jgi:hypothetical protein
VGLKRAWVPIVRNVQELAKHVSTFRLVPSPDGYTAEGEWDLVGSGRPRSELVAGEGFEPSTFGL